MPKKGLEPSCINAPDPKSGVSTNSTTWAMSVFYCTKLLNFTTPQKNMRPAALSIILDKNRVLLVLRSDVPVWVLPGGGIDENETPEQCAIRETFEETGVTSSIQEAVGIYTPRSLLSSPIHVFTATPLSFTFPEELSSESAAVQFFSLESLPRNLFFLHATILEECLSDREKPIRRTLSEITFARALKMCIQHPFVSLRYGWTRFFRK